MLLPERQRTKQPAAEILPLLLLLATCFTTEAWVPPKYNPESWESVHTMRERLGIQYNYTPTLIHPEICRHMSEAECQQGDENLMKHAKAHRALAIPPSHNPNLGTFKVLVLLIVFEDHVNRPRIDKSDVEYMWNTLIPEWLDVNSHGNYDVEPVVAEWVVTDNTELHYSNGITGIVPEFQKAAWPALDALDNTPGWDWSVFDLNGDSFLDSVVITHSGYGAETQTTDEYGREYQNRIWAHAFAQAGSDTWTSKDGSVSLNGYTVASAFEEASGVVPATIGLTAHEYMHTFGLIDLYDLSFEGSGISGFDIMAYPYGNGDSNLPGHLSTWSKMEAEWITPTEITHDGVYLLRPLETSSDSYEIILGYGFSGKEYLLLENRQQLEYDVNLYGTGLAMYHIDDGKEDQNQGGHPGQSGWPQNGNHYKVAMLQADGNYDLEKGSRGDSGDLWQPGQSLGPGNDNTVFPNTDMYSDGFVFESGITVTVLKNAGQNVQFEVSGLGTAPTAPVGSPSAQPSLSPSDFPLEKPSLRPSGSPTASHSGAPSASPSSGPQAPPSHTPSSPPSLRPSVGSSQNPSMLASESPSNAPTTGPTATPSKAPTLSPTTHKPTVTPGEPTLSPSGVPTAGPTLLASSVPSVAPSGSPSSGPTALTSAGSTPEPTASPSVSTAPSSVSSRMPSSGPSRLPSSAPSDAPSIKPSATPSSIPSTAPSSVPSEMPSAGPSRLPSSAPSDAPSITPNDALPTMRPTRFYGFISRPGLFPTPKIPTALTSAGPSPEPTASPSVTSTDAVPTMRPTRFYGFISRPGLFPTPKIPTKPAQSNIFYNVAKETPEPTPSPSRASRDRPTHAHYYDTEVTPSSATLVLTTMPSARGNAVGNLLQPAEESVVATDIDSTSPTPEPFSVSVQMLDNRPPPTPEAFSVSVQMSSHGSENTPSEAHPPEILHMSNLYATSGSSSTLSWLSTMGSISLALSITLLEIN